MGVTAIKLKGDDRVIGFTLADRMRECLTVRTKSGIQPIVRDQISRDSSRGDRAFGILQRGTLDAIIPDEAKPVPSVEEVTE